jgi:hypothetical protein
MPQPERREPERQQRGRTGLGDDLDHCLVDRD